jgi:hypothetical protein
VSERNVVEMVIARAVGGNVASINGSGGRICHVRGGGVRSSKRTREVGKSNRKARATCRTCDSGGVICAFPNAPIHRVKVLRVGRPC